jgi:hypothetical protein
MQELAHWWSRGQPQADDVQTWALKVLTTRMATEALVRVCGGRVDGCVWGGGGRRGWTATGALWSPKRPGCNNMPGVYVCLIVLVCVSESVRLRLLMSACVCACARFGCV